MKHGKYHTPPTAIRDVPGVTCRLAYNRDWHTFTGTMESLIDAGLASADMFPGQPGRAARFVSYRAPGNSNAWPGFEGNLVIIRRGPGLYVVQYRIPGCRLYAMSFSAPAAAPREDGEALFRMSSLRPVQRTHLRLVWSAPERRAAAE